MRHIQASIWLGCLFLFWTSGETTEEVIYRQHYYDNGDEYDQSGIGIDNYYSELSNDASYGGNTGHDNEWPSTDYVDHTEPSEDYDYTMSLPAAMTTASVEDGHAKSTTEAYAEETEQHESTAPITATEHIIRESSAESPVTSDMLQTETSEGYGDEYGQYETEGLNTQAVEQTALETQEASSTTEPSETLETTEVKVLTSEKTISSISDAVPGWTEISTDEEGCSQGQLLCDDGACINTELICDGNNDCKGGEDEDPDMCKAIDEDISSSDSARKQPIFKSNMTFICGSGENISLESAYDTVPDCKDGSDETDRGRDEKMARCFQCEVDGMCLDPKVLCDGTVDCDNGADEDELNCEYGVGSAGDGIITTDEAGNKEIIPVAAVIKNAIESPDLKVESREKVVPNGVIILTCTFGDDIIDEQIIKKATWYKNEIPLRILKEKDSRYGATDNVLHISNINDKDLGRYICVVHLRNGTFVKSDLDVKYSDEWTMTSESAAHSIDTTAIDTDAVFYGETENTEEITGEITEAVTNGITEETMEGMTEGMSEGIIEGMTEGMPEGMSEGMTEGMTEGMAEGMTEAVTEGMTERMTEEMTEGMIEGITDGIAKEPIEGAEVEVTEDIAGGIPIIVPDYDYGETSHGVYIDQSGISTDTSMPREISSTPHYETVVPQETSQSYPEVTEPPTELEQVTEFEESFIDLQNLLRDQQPYMVEEETTPGEILVLRCPLPSVVPFEMVEEMYWMHGGNKIAMSRHKDDHMGMAEVISSPESEGRWDCHVKSGPSDVFLGSNLVHVRDDGREYTSYDTTTGPQIHKTEEIQPSYPEQSLPTEEQLIQWMTSTAAPYSFDLKAEPPYSTLRVGDSVSISCYADNVPPGVAIYFIKTRPYGLALGEVSEYHEGSFANYTLTIGNVKPATSGEYQCIAVTEDRRAVKADFQIAVSEEVAAPPAFTPHYLPAVSLNVGDAMYPENERAELRCSGVLPEDYHRLKWKFNDKEIATDDPAYQVDGSSLYVRNMGPQYAGIYSCSVTGSASATYQPAFGKLLLQTDKFEPSLDFSREHGHEIYTDIQSTSINQGDALTINCFSRYPALSYTWYQLKDGVEVPLGNEQRLYIPSVHEVGSATYVCRANTAYGQTRETVVSVSVAPKIQEELELFSSWIEPATQTVDAGSTAYFTCRTNKEFRSINWERISQDGSTVQVGNEPILMISDVTPEQSGQYSCSAVSDDGSYSRSVAQLTIKSAPSLPDQPIYRELKRCGPDEATCRDGTCIKRQFICDGKPDCPDGTDEKGCGGGGSQDGECHPDQFMCPSTRQCIQKIWLCDGENDCPDGTDEAPRYCEMMPPGLSRACKPSEFQCKNTNYTQCIPKSYVCDESIDCPDQSDEIGCVKPTVINPPESEKEVNLGETLELRCTARGTPLPFINWRLNWGFICGDGYDNGRCTMVHEQDRENPDVVVGILTVRNMRPGDAGAYSCEAINNKGFHFAVPDAFVQVRVSSQPQKCNEIGTAYQEGDFCRCKINVMGPKCDQCKPGYYYLSKDCVHGCTGCFCSGVAKTCVPETSSFETVYVDFSDFGRTWQVVHEDYPANPWISSDVLFNADERSISVSSISSAPYGQLYWQPSRVGSFPLGNLIRSYGGNLVIKFRRVGDAGPLRIQGPLVWLRGNKIDIVNTTTTTIYPEGGIYTMVIKLYEKSFTKLDGTPIDRAHMMMTLANIDKFWIWAGQGGSTEEPPTIVSVSLEIATSSGTGLPASSVEKCSCPPQYTGSSCERCAQGYTKHEGAGLYLGECYSCREHCHGKTDSCNPETGECYNCGENTAGPRCELCATGFRLNTQTGRCEPEEPGQIEVPTPRIVIGDVEYQPPKRIAILLRPGERRVISVISKDIPLKPSSVWLRVESSGQRVPLPDGMSQIGHDLVIENASPHMLGVYEVKLTLDDGEVLTPSVYLEYDNEFTAVQPTLEPQGLVQKALDEAVTISVNLNGFPANKIIWTKDHQQLPSQVIQEFYRLIIHRLSPELCGTYEATLLPYTPVEPRVLQTTIECIPSRHAVDTEEMAYGPPKITLTPSEVNLVEGQTMVVTYEIVGEQPVDLVWKKLADGSLLDMPPSFSILRDRVVLKDSRLEDSGVYRVEATNRFGRDEAILRLAVQRGTLPKSVGAAEPEVFFERTVYEVMPGERVHILPRIRSTAFYQVRWTDGNGDPLPYGVHSDKDALVIDSMTENLAGSYVIEVTTDDARIRVPVEIEILGQQHQHHIQHHEQRYEYHQSHQQYEQTSVQHEYGSKIELSLPQQFTVEAGNSFEIRCEASGVDPRQLVFTWKKHGHDGEESLPSNVQPDGQILRGSNVQLSDYAYYMCQAENPQTGQQAVAYTLLNVQNRKVRPVARIFPTNSLQISLGDSASFTCFAQQGDPAPNAVWSRVDGRPIVPPSRSYSGQLDLFDVSQDEAGQYRCLLTNEAGQDEAIATVEIKAPPEIRLMVKPEEIQDITDDTAVYVQCIASGTPTPYVYWTHENKNITAAEPGYSLLLIQPLNLSGMNAFECVAVNAHDKKTRRILVNVIPPRPKVHHSEIYGHTPEISIRPVEPRVGDDLLLTCSLNDGPSLSRPVTYTWNKDGRHLTTNMNLERFDIHFIKQASEHDSGNYQCSVSDGITQIGTASFTLSLQGNTHSPFIEERSAVEGGIVEFCCQPRPTPVLRVHWTRHGNHLPQSSSIVDNKLRIENLQQKHSGIYVCTSWDGQKAYEDYFNLTVKIPTLMADKPRNKRPSHIRVVATPTSFGYGAKVTLQCVSDSREPLMYSWLKDGRPTMRSGVSIQGSELSLYVQHSDLGIYTCDVSRPTEQDISGSSSVELIADLVRVGLVNVVPAEKPTAVKSSGRINGAKRPVLIKIRPLQGDYHLNGQVGFECDTSAVNAPTHWERRSPNIILSPSARIEMNRIMFERFTQDDIGEYACIVEKNGQKHEKILHLDVDLSNQDVVFAYPEHPLVISHGAPNINVTFLNPPSEFKRGGNIEVECIVSGQRSTPITWSREQKNLSSNTFIRGNVLKFHHFLEHNLGEYRCSARTSVGELSKIIVFEPESFAGLSLNSTRRKPKIDFQFLSSRSDFRAGGHVVVECFTSDPNARVTWRKLSKSASRGMRVKERFLIISPFSSDDLGTYECKAVGRQGVAVRSIEFDKHDLSANVLPVNEEVLPHVEMKMNENNVYKLGGKIDITCEVQNDPSARVNWHRGEGKAPGSRTEFRDGTLRFHDVSAEDAGVYSCFATNAHGSKYISFEVQIGPDGKVHIVNEQENKIPTARTRIPLITEFLTPLSQFQKGGEITIICYFANDQPGRIEWTKVTDDLKRKLPLQNSAQITGSRIIFSSFDQDDLGSYQCTGYGEHGIMKKIVKLDADTFSVLKRLPQRYAQRESEQLQIAVTGNEIGQRVKLWCKMGSARLAVKWEFDGGNLPDDKDVVQIGTRLLFNKFLPRHHGVYTCKARFNGTKLLKHIDTRMHIKNGEDTGMAKWLMF